ncbi:hypothetical protein MTYM_00126 [Methylococcales bacterium]|nr:hypothetical protein MTYM_00126 [Methylococcales bacterium]
MLLWIQLWMPILAVINLFIQMSAAGKMAALTTATYNLPSMMGIYQLDMELQQWLSIGGIGFSMHIWQTCGYLQP